MKKNLNSLTLCLLAFVLFGTLNAQTETRYQLRNGDFEAPFVAAPGASATGTEPPYWHSFGSLTGPQASLARSGAQISRSPDTRHGTGVGYYSCMLSARSIIIAIANGNMTTGRINAGSTSPANVANHNFTDPNDDNFNEPWTSTPDSIRFWAKYTPSSATQYARMSTYIHDDFLFSDPLEGRPGSADYVVAFAEFEWQRGNQTWQQYTIPFDYATYAHLGNQPKYILITFTTNRTPGSGSGNDRLYIDDIEMVYSAWLTDLKVNDETIDGFQQGLKTYGGPKLEGEVGTCAFPYQPEDFSWTPESSKITDVTVTNVEGPLGDADEGYTSILVTAQDSVTQVEYRIYYYANRSDDNTIASLSYTLDGETDIPVPGFIPTTTNYNITLTDPEEVRIPQIIPENVVLADTTAIIQRIEQPTNVNSRGTVVVQAQNLSLKSYNVIFSKVVSSNATLDWIKIGGTDIAGFDSDTLNYIYETTTCITTIPTITYQKSSAWSNVVYIPATLTNRTATITVTAENDTTVRIYQVSFKLMNSNTVLSSYRVGSTNRSNNAFTAANNYTDVYSANFTSVPALSFHSTTAQQLGCAGASVVWPSAVFFPDTNYIKVTAQNQVDTQMYRSVLKNTNCYVATGPASGESNSFGYNYNGLTNQNTGINITTANNNNTNTITTSVVTLPVGRNVPPELVIRALATTVAPPSYTIRQPEHRNDTAIVTLTANDSTIQKIYRIPFRATLSADAMLSSITYDGIPVPGFNPATEFYTLIFPSTVTEVPTIEFTVNFQWLADTNVVYTPAASLLDTAMIEVTAEDGTTKTYRIAFKVVPQEEDAYLLALWYNNIVVPNFNPTVFNYVVDIPFTTTTPPALTALPSSPTALVLPVQPMATPPFTSRLLVYSEDMTEYNIYTVSYNLVKDTNPTLAAIQVNGVPLQGFDSQVFEYGYELLYTELNAPVVTATPAYEHAQVEITPIEDVNGIVTIHVTAEDEIYTETYTINFTRELSPVTSIETIVYEYNNQTYSYEVSGDETEITIILPVETTGTPFISDITLTDDRADVEIDEQPDATNNFTGTVTVTAEDLTEEIYSIAFEKTLSESTLLTGIYYNGIPVPDFDPEVSTYYIILPFNNSQIPVVTVTKAWQNTDVAITQLTSNPFGQVPILVTSENGQNNKTYTIVFQRKGNPYLVDLSYTLDGVNHAIPEFMPSIFTYNITLDIATNAIPELVYLAEDSRCTIVLTTQDEPNGTSKIKLITWNQDDSLTYTVNFTVLLSTEALLSDLQVSGTTIANFNPNTLNYVVKYPYGTAELPVITAEATQLDAQVEITQITGYPGTATITVFAGDVTITRTYTISFSVEPGNNTYLADIFIDGAPLWGFNKDVYFYEWVLPFGITDLPEIDAIAEDSTATVTIIPALQIGDTTKIWVTSLNENMALYQIYFTTEKSSNAYASNIFVDWEPLEGFVRYLPDYTHWLPANYVGEPFVVVTLEDPNASYQKEWLPTPTITPLQLQITVTAENGVNEFTYTITFDKLSSIATFNNEAKIQVYPNPSSDNIHFIMNETIQASSLELYSIENKRIGSYNLQGGENTVNIEHLPKGAYFYRISTGNAILGTGKFVKN